MSRMYFPIPKGFTPEPRTKYTVVLESGAEKALVFTEKNNLLDKEKHMGFYHHECVDENKQRYIINISECYSEKDVLVIYLEENSNMWGVEKIVKNKTELVYCLSS